MRLIVLWFVCLAVFLAEGKAQTARSVNKRSALTIGEALPALSSFPALHYEKDTLSLQQYKAKVVILDFFDTFCSSCIASLPKLQKLQDSLPDELKIVMVTWQSKETIETFLKKNSFLKDKDVRLPFIYDDQLLKQFFPHKGIPHMVWLYNGKVQATTYSDFLNRENVMKLFRDGNIDLPLKDDYGKTELKINHEDNLIASVMLKQYQNGIPSISFRVERDSTSGMMKSSIYNQSIFTSYVSIFLKIRKLSFLVLPERVVWKVSDSSRYDYFGKDHRRRIWLAQNGICYERFDHKELSDSARARQSIEDLNKFLGLDVYWSTALRPTLVIREAKGKQARKMREKNLLHNPVPDGILGGTETLAFMLDMSGAYPPALDEANYPGAMDLQPYNNIQELNSQLQKFGLEIIETKREIEVLVFEEKMQ